MKLRRNRYKAASTVTYNEINTALSDAPTAPSSQKASIIHLRMQPKSRKIRKVKNKQEITRKNIKLILPKLCTDKRLFHQRTIDSVLKRESVSSREENEESKQRWLELTDKDNVFTHRYPLFLESALQFLRNPVIQSVQMNDMTVDNDCETDDEQISEASSYLEKSIKEGVQEFKTNHQAVHNYARYAQRQIDQLFFQKYSQIPI